jgi:hypothetical protein
MLERRSDQAGHVPQGSLDVPATTVSTHPLHQNPKAVNSPPQHRKIDHVDVEHFPA